MSRGQFHQTVRGSIQNLFFNDDAEARGIAAATLGSDSMGVANEREALEALNTALHDPSVRVQDAVLQSLVRISRQ